MTVDTLIPKSKRCTSTCPEVSYLRCERLRNHDGACSVAGYGWSRGRGHYKPQMHSRPDYVERARKLANIEEGGFLEFPLVFGIHRLPANERRCPAWPADTAAMREARFTASLKRFAARMAAPVKEPRQPKVRVELFGSERGYVWPFDRSAAR